MDLSDGSFASTLVMIWCAIGIWLVCGWVWNRLKDAERAFGEWLDEREWKRDPIGFQARRSS